MADEYLIEVSPQASKDIEEIYPYILNVLCNPIAANNLIDEIQSAILNLKSFPFMYFTVQNELVRDQTLRKLVIKKYLVFYRVKENKIQIVSVLSGLCDYQHLL